MTIVFLPFSAASSTSPTYLAVSDLVEGGHLSPRSMQWSEQVVLIDLSPTIRYWKQQATERGLPLEDFLMTLLPATSVGVLARHPWQALLHLKTYSARGRGQLINLDSPLGKSLHGALDWMTWQETCHEIAEHFSACGTKTNTLKANLSSFLKTAENMQVATPAQLKGIEHPNMRRRFGALIATLWEWTWQEDTSCDKTSTNTLKDGFPWRLIKPQEIPTVKNLLNHPLREWDHISPILCEDLDRICNLACWNSSERVVSLEWALSFSNSPTLTIPVSFRHPHPLHREAGHHKTALLQAFHSWTSALQKRLRDSNFKPDTQYLDNDSVYEWTLTIKERLILPAHAKSLFTDDMETPLTRLRDLENSLPIDLESFDITSDWTPEGSWRQSSTTEAQPIHLSSLHAQHLAQPLFIQRKPTPIPPPDRRSLIFTERTMRKWWEKNDTQNHVRDYYVRIHHNSPLQWVYQDQQGDFFLHGMYG